MGLLQRILIAREVAAQMPSYLFHFLFSWLYSTVLLRAKAASSPHPLVRRLLLSRSGVRIGAQVNINFGDFVQGGKRRPCPLTLGDRVALGPYITFITTSGPNESRLGDHPEVQPMIAPFSPIQVCEDAWIGAGAVIFPGVTIGRAAIVGAGAVVLRSVPPLTVVAGVPAREIRKLPPEGEPER